MEALRKLFVSLGLDWDAAGFAQAQLAVDGLEKGLGLLVDAAKAVVVVLKEATLETAALADRLNDASIKTGVGIDTLQELGFAAMQSGVSQEEMETALTRLSRQMSAAAEGSKEAASAFAQLKTKVTNADGSLRSVDDVFAELADRVIAVENPTKRSALAMEIFGRSGANLLPLLMEGGEGIDKLREEAVDLGLVMGIDAVKAGAAFNDTVEALEASWQSLKRDLGGPIIEALLPIVLEFKEWVKANRALIRSGLTSFSKSLVSVFTGLGRAVDWLRRHWDSLAIIVVSVLLPALWAMRVALLEQLVAFALNTASAIAYGAAQVAAGLAAAAAWAAANAPLLLSAALLLLVLASAQDVYYFLTGGDSVIGSLGVKWTKFLDQWSQSAEENDVIRGLKLMVFYLSDLEGRLLPLLKSGWWSAIVQPISAAIELLFKLFRGTASFADYLKTIPGLGLLIESVQSNAAKAAPLFTGELFSGGASSVAAGVASKGPMVMVSSPKFDASITVNAQPGQSSAEVADKTREAFEESFDSKMRQLR